jgi:hypothetical protein
MRPLTSVFESGLLKNLNRVYLKNSKCLFSCHFFIVLFRIFAFSARLIKTLCMGLADDLI